MTEADERVAFMAAIVKMADDAEFRREFLHAYNLFLHPPLMVDSNLSGVVGRFDLRAGAINYVTPEEMEKLNRHVSRAVPAQD